MNYSEKIARVYHLISTATNAFALTGAGISTESGIPDYRTPKTGLWEKTDPAKVATVTAFFNDPAGFWNYHLPRWEKIMAAEPNNAHHALAQLEKRGFLRGVITQNIDGLHFKAGTQNLWEVHGHLRTCRCLTCGEHFPFTELHDLFKSGLIPPYCQQCHGILRPDVVLFEDAMAPDFFKALEELRNCELLVVVGTSLQVYPVADLPRKVKRLVIINLMPTPFDTEAEVVINEPIGQVFKDLLTFFDQETSAQ
jgi:NAD-dependent deacetylase